ncbi:hypothetical protein ACS0TY_015166 [Phlomoides rotata]
MEQNGAYSNVLGLEMSLHHPLQPRNPPNHHPMEAYGGDYHLQAAKQGYPTSVKSKNLTLSDDDEPNLTGENCGADDGKRKMSPWQRMKWTDNMVRLLIMVVYYIGDEPGSDLNDPVCKKKGGGGALQKKGKWKSVSRAMMERGFYVSPQQCEDKFNDLNKRYKRVNDILGKGTSCKVVEKQSLLDSMDHISGKMKEEVKKLLNSKHLFFREMCAYHNSCGHGGAAEPAAAPPQRCLHAAAEKSPNLNIRGESKLGAKAMSIEDDDEDDDDDDDEEDEEEEEEDEEGDTDERTSAKRIRRTPTFQQLDGEMMSILRDGSKSSSEKRMWMRTRIMALEEQRVGIQSQAFELEKQRLKWLKFSSKKEREMEKEKLMNERLKLENERMVLLIRRKDLDLVDQQQQQHSSSKRSDTSIAG